MENSDLALTDYVPRPRLSVAEHLPEKPRFPVVDGHNHLGGAFSPIEWLERPLSELLERMDEAGVTAIFDMDGGWGEDVLNKHLDHFKNGAPERFYHFGGIDWSQWPEQGDRFAEWATARLCEQVRRGAQGLKVWKPFGLRVTDQRGELAAVDDPRLIPIWETAADLHIPVTIHVADPVAFFDPLDRFNERGEELHAHPDWRFPSPPFPAFESIVGSFARLVLRHPRTTFIGAHVGCYAENLAWVSDLMDRAPNLYVDIAARIGELGRQPYSARRFFIKHADRIVFGTDVGVDTRWYRIYYRFLETEDEYINYDLQEIPTQGRWRIYGVFLPDDVLEKVYRLNAYRALGLR
jgi:predicted TIM-barrel fold metal-dependent hydrolase